MSAEEGNPQDDVDGRFGDQKAGSREGNQKLRCLAYVSGAVALVGFLLLFYMLIWVEKLSGKEVFSKTFTKARVVRPAQDAPASPRARGPRARPELKLQKLYEANKIGPYRLTPAQNPFRCSLHMETNVYDAEKSGEEPLTYQISMTDESSKKIWESQERVPQESGSAGSEPSSHAFAVKVFSVPSDGEFTFWPRITAPGVVVHRAKLSLRRNVQVGSQKVALVGCVMFLLGLLVSISASKAYDLSRGKTGHDGMAGPDGIADAAPKSWHAS